MNKKYLYHIKADIKNQMLCAAEMNAIFNQTIKNDVIFSSVNIPPATSPFIKSQLQILYTNDKIDDLIKLIKTDNFQAENFRIEFIRIDKNAHSHHERLTIQKAIANAISGYGTIKNQAITFAITFIANRWYFGQYLANNYPYKAHDQKPHSYCNAIGSSLSRSILNIALKDNRQKKIIDPCCGIGTIILEGLSLGLNIYGNELCVSVGKKAIKNLEYFNYKNVITIGDMHDINQLYDVAILDMPYGIMSNITQNQQLKMINKCLTIAKELVIIASFDVSDLIKKEQIIITNFIKVAKTNKGTFTRYIILCHY